MNLRLSVSEVVGSASIQNKHLYFKTLSLINHFWKVESSAQALTKTSPMRKQKYFRPSFSPSVHALTRIDLCSLNSSSCDLWLCSSKNWKLKCFSKGVYSDFGCPTATLSTALHPFSISRKCQKSIREDQPKYNYHVFFSVGRGL